MNFNYAKLGDPGTWQGTSPTSFTDCYPYNSSFVATDFRNVCVRLILFISLPSLCTRAPLAAAADCKEKAPHVDK